MKAFLLYLALFTAAILLLPMTALDPVGSSAEESSSTVQVVIRQEDSLSSSAREPDREAMEPVTSISWKEPKQFKILDRSTGRIQEVAVLDYLRGAVAAEMPPTFHPEALKAQAVAAHTYALYCCSHPDETLGGADFSADPQLWQGYVTQEQMLQRYPQQGEKYWQIICEAVDAAASTVLFYGDEPALAAYHAMSAGSTEYASNVWNGSVDYLIPVNSYGDTLAEGFQSAMSFSPDELQLRLSQGFSGLILPDDPQSWVQILSRSPSGYVLTVQVGNLTLTGQQLRQALGLRSTHFTFELRNNELIFTTLGYGHGVGLSQNGADWLARQGKRFDEILLHYYSGVTLHTLQ